MVRFIELNGGVEGIQKIGTRSDDKYIIYESSPCINVLFKVIWTVKHGLVNIMWTYLMTLDFSTDCGPSRKYGIEQRVPTCPENEALLIHTHCGLFHKATTIYVLFCPKKTTFL